MLEVAYVGSQGRDMVIKVDINQAPPVVGVSDANVNRPFITLAPAVRSLSQSQSIGKVDYNGLLVKAQRRFANNFSFLTSYTFGKSMDYASDNEAGITNTYDLDYNWGPSDYDVRHTLSGSVIYELPWAREKLYGGWQLSGIFLARGGLPLTVTHTQGVQSTGTGNRPNRICDGNLSNPTIDRWFDTACFVQTADITGTYGDAGRGIIRGPGSFNIDASLIKNTRIGGVTTEVRIEAFNVLNHPQFANPNTTIGNAAAGTISAMLSSPSCSLCGTVERQVQVDDRQSNFDEATGKFVVASDGAVVNGVEVGRYLQTYSKGDLGPRLGFAYDLNGSGRTIVRGGFGIFWNFTPGGTSGSKAQNPPFLQATALNASPTAYGANLLLRTGLPEPPGTDPARPAAGSTRSIFEVDFRDAYARQWNVNVQRSIATNYMVEIAYVGSQGRQMLIKGDPNQAPPIVGVTDSNVNRPFILVSPQLRTIGQVQSRGTLDYNGLLVKFQRRFANNFSFLNSYTYGKAIDLNSDNDGLVTLTNVYDPQYNRGPADYDITHTLSSSWIYEFPWARTKLYGGWQVSGILLLRGGLPLTVTQTQGVQSTGTGNRPNRICDGNISNPTIDRWFDLSCFVPTTDVTGTYGDAGRNIIRGPGSFNIDASLIKNTRIGNVDTEFRIEAFNLLNHPQFANPNTTIGNAAAGVISAMLSNPSCSVCGTVERQIQLGVKVRF